MFEIKLFFNSGMIELLVNLTNLFIINLLDRKFYINAVFCVGDYEFSAGHMFSYYPNDFKNI
ncbi:hypothetical protein A2296_01380 [candidate division CPR3 bacterium RIFOXYB2_FULL_35_8]|uniref:Uncharacterized protein n=1 Tax=candidate division CPR3 bacterium GW2011_GWF2_35_18 TaxID=1618350 RepID=A0A0G0BL66_UNCC3|nr:MAG: hypothetical protein UR67_C0001G0138 [candidate division CPR3 bacterium GW2011_GWF2_35_18]OGB64811.1 MAG: hypothetical protein A2250_05250 [candidate division CPR3 bacterium RIFOXYA2_FULL_35_13]OGB77015.1 MAG: hypothetical protein A2476_02260 [candidate division CPR3 bacterium RIFOXYC2_FULL_35_7]OGB78561.1 MAG: hypothetical protein A2296_01380 [candidate division CPR3 bacterium RIFOXYB2_FULL_35_8]